MKITTAPGKPTGMGFGVDIARDGSLAVVPHDALFEVPEAAKRFKELRIQKGLTSREAAELLGIDAVALAQLQVGMATIPDEQWKQMMDKLGAYQEEKV